MTPLDAPLWAPTRYTGQQSKRQLRRTLIDSRCPLVSMISINSNGIQTLGWHHWNLYKILFPFHIKNVQNGLFMRPGRRFWCVLLVDFEVGSNLGCLGLHLGDSNCISLAPSSWLGHPCWTPPSPCHAPIMVACMNVMYSSLLAFVWLISKKLAWLKLATSTWSKF